MRELREFRAQHGDLARHGVSLAGVTRDTIESNSHWARRLDLPYPLLSDVRGEAGRGFHVVRRLGIGGWTIELLRRTTFLIDTRGIVAAAWGKVRIRGHAREVLAAALALGPAAAPGVPTPSSPSPPPA